MATVHEMDHPLIKHKLALMRDKTCFVIAHRLSTIRSADTILVVRDGAIVEQGNHEALMKKSGFYVALYRAQFS